MKPSRFRLLSILLTLPLAALLVAAVEGLLVLCDVAPRQPPAPIALRANASAQQTVRWDRDLLYRYAPNADILGFYRTNSLGYRGGEFGERPAQGGVRILCLGDSCTFGLGLSESDTYVRRLESALDAAFEGALDFEVLNLGVVGYSTYQTRRQLEIDGARLHPDIVILMPTAFNDATAAPERTDRERAADNRSLLTDLRQLRLARLLGTGDPIYEVPKQIELAAASKRRCRVSLAERREELDACFTAAQSIATRLLPVRFACAESAASVDPDLRARSQTVSDLATEHGLLCVDIESEFASLAPLELYTDGVHPTPFGARVIANALFHALLQSGWLPDGARTRFLAEWSKASQHGFDAQALLPLPADEQAAPSAFRSAWQALGASDDPTLASAPAGDLVFDPLTPQGRGDYPAGWLVLAGDRGSTLARSRFQEIEANVRPRDPLARFLGIASFAEPMPASSRVRFARAAVVLERSLAIAPSPTDRRLGNVESALRRHDLSAARTTLEKVLTLAPANPDGLVLRAKIARLEGDAHTAQDALERALAAHPDHPEALAALATLALDVGDRVRAEPLLGRALSVHPFDLDCRYAWARLLVAKGERDAARAELELLLAINASAIPEAAELLRSLGGASVPDAPPTNAPGR